MELQRQGTTLTPGTSLFDDITGTYWFPKFAAINMMLRPRNNRFCLPCPNPTKKSFVSKQSHARRVPCYRRGKEVEPIAQQHLRLPPHRAVTHRDPERSLQHQVHWGLIHGVASSQSPQPFSSSKMPHAPSGHINWSSGLEKGIHHIPLSPLFPPTGEDTWLKTGDELIYCEKQIWDD
ncbi:hypothetical protein MG293_018130 [Ovis ammon polii]|uniref:Uncharacterized protein n=1 Tax=Ovis ammon polii TaxID=230172 RepID=A0AAD4TRY6_OVIAM|nr:hypothetical protein MG293_018130 [Ovis ammon polii]